MRPPEKVPARLPHCDRHVETPYSRTTTMSRLKAAAPGWRLACYEDVLNTGLRTPLYDI